MGNNRQNSGGTSKSAAAPVDQYRRSIGKHQEKLLSEGNLHRKKVQKQKEEQEQMPQWSPASKKFKVAFVAVWVLIFTAIYLGFKYQMAADTE